MRALPRFLSGIWEAIHGLVISNIICMTTNKMCESCMMPFNKDPGVRESDRYCSYCFKNGRLCYEGDDLQEFKRVSYQNMVAHGTNKFMAKFYTFMIGFAPRWKK